MAFDYEKFRDDCADLFKKYDLAAMIVAAEPGRGHKAIGVCGQNNMPPDSPELEEASHAAQVETVKTLRLYCLRTGVYNINEFDVVIEGKEGE